MKRKKGVHKNKRLGIVIAILTSVFIILFAQLFRIMIINRSFLVSQGEEQSTKELMVMPKRGSILDRNGNELAVSADVYKVRLDLQNLDEYSIKYKKSKDIIADEISNALNLDVDNVRKSMEKKNAVGGYLRDLELARKIKKEVIDKVKQLRSDKQYYFMVIENDTNRYYPNNNFLAHALGAVDSDGSGLLGLEKYYDKDLTGVPGIKISEVDRISQELPYDDPISTQPINGKNITLTIDASIQFIAEKAAEKAMEDTKAKGVSIIVTDPKSGEILSMVNKPDFNPNDPRKGVKTSDELHQLWRNWAVNDAVEPGSTFKIVTTAAALEEELTYKDDQFYDKGYIIIDGVAINCWKPGGHGQENLVDILKNSCNPGFIELGKRLGKEKLNEYINKFGFGNPVGIDLPGETSGIIKPTNKMSNVDLATISFGQADAASMVQLIAALNTVMNNGVYTTPHLMKSMSSVGQDGNSNVVQTYQDKNVRQVISEKTANELAGYLEQVVSTGSAKAAYIEGYGIAGKTGTAEKANIGGKGYSEGKYVASFVGAAPYDDPKVSLLIAIDEPKGQYFGGDIAAPVAKDLFEQIFKEMSFKPVKN
ncbi:stage V sporulation protein D [Clostridium polyendosporum]|uniref:Stage V sporulation protein D n=1 Tax=Clostridium polyendosporum TaxID=69208 RepID=A0A919VHA8_9CLOT|nr:penicillin-binding transpeptidase domain-containing protein [Clostridium polyendosporum]GIM30062.1 stage V sporulation protein D [Clostridium polyendosporum]